MWRIKCNNGKYVSKTSNGSWISFTKNGKVWHSENLVNKNFDWCKKWAASEFIQEREGNLTFEIEKIN